ncbi:Lipin [Lasiodiplodia theobromae]|uniref:Phosphatidic acid phosphohydrolase 1 n=2 Tax=Lasiodiplodia TaxID=66739 RepID=A0A5N5DE66_9PEZI|nr:Nuclear elongation and deformation protein [Lasiodiplodia theobromae]KAB2576163.1 Phosphatidic acid phosphohydrolase 1 [Lasiodiplodia theobromae]KAF4545655.1 Nuclear elongation and deformation protein [Lasiodiplodia theobromae]KAF9636207.1 Lipin [Lasiodiplodia theobromae]KAK0650846.1 Phosphatidic acid phosphohydrolase 1 [Lasiodiplodia hormozganensis]
MQYVRGLSSSVSKTWNSINPATLSGAIDVIVVEHEDGSLACSPFHVRFGKFSLLRPYEKKVEFCVNGTKQPYSMKLGEGGEAFFVFETTDSIPESMQTSPLVSPAQSPESKAESASADQLSEPPPLSLATDGQNDVLGRVRAKSDLGDNPTSPLAEHASAEFPILNMGPPAALDRGVSDEILPSTRAALSKAFTDTVPTITTSDEPEPGQLSHRSTSPPPVSRHDAVARAMTLSKKLWTSNVPSQVTEEGDLMLDMTGYKSNEEDALRAEIVARKILSEELEGNYDIGALIGADEKGNLWIYSSEEAKEAAARKLAIQGLQPQAMRSSDAISDPGYHSDDSPSDAETEVGTQPQHMRRDSDSGVGLLTPPKSPHNVSAEGTKSYAKTLRLTDEQLKSLDLKPGENSMSFTVNRATCQAFIYYWRHDVPIVISDIDGTITKSDALGHVLNMIGRDWTHLGVAKLYTDIATNGYNLLYLTSRSVGQADTTRAYLNGVVQEGYKLPRGPVIMSPDRTMAALRREIYLRKPEVFKMACLRDIMNLFTKPPGQTPFYAGFGNRFTDALSYRSVNIPSTRIFTINSNAEVSLDLLSLNKYKTGYQSMREIVDHYFPPVGLLVQNGGEEFTDFNYWRERPLDLDEFSASESSDSSSSEDEDEDRRSLHSEDEAEIEGELGDSYLSRDSIDETGQMEDSMMEDSMMASSIAESAEGDGVEDEEEEYEDEEEEYEAEDEIGEEEALELDRQLDALDLDSDSPPSPTITKAQPFVPGSPARSEKTLEPSSPKM